MCLFLTMGSHSLRLVEMQKTKQKHSLSFFSFCKLEIIIEKLLFFKVKNTVEENQPLAQTKKQCR